MVDNSSDDFEEYFSLVEMFANTGHDFNTPEHRRIRWREGSTEPPSLELVGTYGETEITIQFDGAIIESPEEVRELAKQAAELVGC